MVAIAVIADDLTGANDTGVQFANKGLETFVLLSDAFTVASQTCFDVVVFNTESRAAPSEEAYQRVFELTVTLRDIGITNVFKKIDSTLRGNLGKEIDAVMDALNYENAFVVPAFPRNNRITIHGRHFVNNVPLQDTEFSKDPFSPVTEGCLPKLLQDQSRRTISLIPLEIVRKGTKSLFEEMQMTIASAESRITCIDATNEDELRTIVEAGKRLGKKFLWVGSAGIARYLSDVIRDEAMNKLYQGRGRRSVLMLAGSLSTVVEEQLNVLNQERIVKQIVIAPEMLFEEETCKKEIGRVVAEGAKLLRKTDLVIRTKRKVRRISAVEQIIERKNLSKGVVGQTISNAMAMIAEGILRDTPSEGLILTGGDIAGATCRMLKAEGMKVIGEVESGLPYGTLIGGKYDGLPIITKAGAFGSKQALVKSLDKLIEGKGF